MVVVGDYKTRSQEMRPQGSENYVAAPWGR